MVFRTVCDRPGCSLEILFQWENRPLILQETQEFVQIVHTSSIQQVYLKNMGPLLGSVSTRSHVLNEKCHLLERILSAKYDPTLNNPRKTCWLNRIHGVYHLVSWVVLFLVPGWLTNFF